MAAPVGEVVEDHRAGGGADLVVQGILGAARREAAARAGLIGDLDAGLHAAQEVAGDLHRAHLAAVAPEVHVLGDDAVGNRLCQRFVGFGLQRVGEGRAVQPLLR